MAKTTLKQSQTMYTLETAGAELPTHTQAVGSEVLFLSYIIHVLCYLYLYLPTYLYLILTAS